MKKNKMQDKANKLLEQHPKENKVFITQDGQPFFSENKAKNHSKTNRLKDPEVFFRNGEAPEDQSDLQEAYLEAENQLAIQDEVIKKVTYCADMDNEAIEVNKDTHPAVVAVIQLRENYETVATELTDVREELEALKKVNNQEKQPTAETPKKVEPKNTKK